jgi:hypothetical protein
MTPSPALMWATGGQGWRAIALAQTEHKWHREEERLIINPLDAPEYIPIGCRASITCRHYDLVVRAPL